LFTERALVIQRRNNFHSAVSDSRHDVTVGQKRGLLEMAVPPGEEGLNICAEMLYQMEKAIRTGGLVPEVSFFPWERRINYSGKSRQILKALKRIKDGKFKDAGNQII